MSQQLHPFVPELSRRIRKLGTPLEVIIALGTVAGLLVILVADYSGSTLREHIQSGHIDHS
ncbi:MAG TPA: hypothetical protein VEH31_00405 [Streptosporangiaceae bacterium]|nr:hypothetical protein [Streptosporangiaceae bacterium]